MAINPFEQLGRTIAKMRADSELDITQLLVEPAQREAKRLHAVGDTTSLNHLLEQNVATARGLQTQLFDTLDQIQAAAEQTPAPMPEPIVPNPIPVPPPIDGVRPPGTTTTLKP